MKKKECIDEKKCINLFCFNNDKPLYNELKQIYTNYYEPNQKNKNPFITYMKEKMNIVNDEKIKNSNNVIKWIELSNGRKIKKLFYFLNDSSSSTDGLLILNSHNKNAILESLNSLEARIYKDNNNKYKKIVINQKVLDYDKNTSKLKINNDKLNKLLIKNNISNINYLKIKIGMIFINNENNKLFYCNAFGSQNENKIELKCLEYSNVYYWMNFNIKHGDSQFLVSISTLVEKYDTCEVDELGNIYNRKKIML